MTGTVKTSLGASSASPHTWNSIDWKKVEANVHRLQMRIAKAQREGRHGKVNSLQWILTHSYHAKLLAVKRVTQNKGANTPGVDQVTWKTPKQKLQAARSLRRKTYKTQPLKRLKIPKRTPGKYRYLHIPVMKCRAMQALHLLALEPISEMLADKNSYGFRPKRSATDAIDQCFKSLSRKTSARYILEGDIKSCFDTLSHPWLLKHIFMDKKMLKQWLQAGYFEKGKCYPTRAGTPQGGIISPTLLVITLAGLEKAVKTATQPSDKVNVCVYADDFIITGATKAVLEETVRPVVDNFLKQRGLLLSKEKTRITTIEEGFDFLGFNLRKYNGKMIIKPSKESVKTFLSDIRRVVKSKRARKTEELIQTLNPKIRGWTNYYRYACSKQTFSKVDYHIFCTLWKWAKRRHPRKGARWIRNKYFRTKGLRQWVFTTRIHSKTGEPDYLNLILASSVRILRVIKIRADATPYDPAYTAYFEKRRRYKVRSSGGIRLDLETCAG